MEEHSMSFKGNEIQVKPHICDRKSIILYDETLLDNEEMIWIGSLTTTNAPEQKELEIMVSEEYHSYINLF
jgi:hypothetical protein